MGNSVNRQISQNQQKKAVRSALDRIESLEKDLIGLVNGINQVVGPLAQKMPVLEEIVQALVGQVGQEQVDSAIQAARTKRAQEASDASKAMLEEAIKAGSVVPTDKVTEKSVLVGEESDKDGNVIHPGRVQLTYDTIKPEFKTQLLGQEAGFSVDTPAGGKFKVTEVYNMVDKAPDAPPADAVPAAAPADSNPVPVATDAPAAPADAPASSPDNTPAAS